jgi:hypothetical protein
LPDSDSDGGDLVKILNKIANKKREFYKINEHNLNNEKNNDMSGTEFKNVAFFESENEIDEDSKKFYEFIYIIKY